MSAIARFLEERKAQAALDRVLREHRLVDRSAPDFCITSKTRRLVSRQQYEQGSPEWDLAVGKPMVVMIAVPNSVPRPIFSTASNDFWGWLDDEAARRYAPDTYAPFFRAQAKGMFGGALVEERYNGQPTTYLAIERSGVIESATVDKAALIHQGNLYYHSAAIVGRAWQFLSFCCDLYRTFSRDVGFVFGLGIRSTKNTILFGFGPGWRAPDDPLSSPETCFEPGLRFIRDDLRSDATPDQIEAVVRDIATDLGNAWGHREARCYAHPLHDPTQRFSTNAFQQFTYNR